MIKCMQGIKVVLIIFICILSYKLIKSSKVSLGNYAKDKVDEKLRKIPSGYFSYERLEKHLIKMGEKITPAQFIMIKLELSILLMLIGIQFGNILLGCVLAIIGFYLHDKRLERKNDRENDKILKDLQRVYDVLRIETKSGVHISDAISECYLIASNKRLKEGLLALSSGLSTNKDMKLVLQEFNDKFDNPYIDSFCIIISQSLETGKTVQILEDLSEQMNDIEEATYLSEEDEIENKSDRIQFFVYILGMITVLYGLVLKLMESAMKF